MSWWISLQNKDGEPIDTDEIRAEGGTQVLGGTTIAELNVTYNYGKHFNFRSLDGLSAGDAILVLSAGISKLKKDDVNDDYWEPTEGNARKALVTLFDFAAFAVKKEIEAIFIVH